LRAFLISPIRATYPAHLTDFITLTIIGEVYKLWSASLCTPHLKISLLRNITCILYRAIKLFSFIERTPNTDSFCIGRSRPDTYYEDGKFVFCNNGCSAFLLNVVICYVCRCFN
jgi:hypothetical protein